MTRRGDAIAQQILSYLRTLQLRLDEEAVSQELEPPQHEPSFTILRYLRLRRYRERLFPPGLFADPAWDILLDLLIAERAGRKVSVTSACLGSGAPATTALRWISTLSTHGLIEKRQDTTDRRRAYLSLTDPARSALLLWEREAKTAEAVRTSPPKDHLFPSAEA